MGESIANFYELDAWRHGHGIVLGIYAVTKNFPKDEMFGLVSQMRRASVSVTSNISEGFARRSIKEKLHFYNMAAGSLSELHNQLFIVKDVGYVDLDVFLSIQEKVVTTHKILNGLISKTKTLIE